VSAVLHDAETVAQLAQLATGPGHTIVRLQHGTAEVFDRVITPLVALELPPPTPSYRRCPTWWVAGHCHYRRGGHPAPRLRRVSPQAWPHIIIAYQRWGIAVPEVLREGRAVK
jgi:hypothetical protein